MSAILSKLTMCVCAGTLGAVSVPAVHHAQQKLRAHNAASHRAPPHKVASAKVEPCDAGVAGGAAGRTAALPALPQASASSLSATSPTVATQTAMVQDALPVASLVDVGSGWGPTPIFGGGFIGGGGGGGSIPSKPDQPAPPAPGDSDGTPTPVSQVPEPAVWAQMILGLGAVGVIARRGRRPIANANCKQL